MTNDPGSAQAAPADAPAGECFRLELPTPPLRPTNRTDIPRRELADMWLERPPGWGGCHRLIVAIGTPGWPKLFAVNLAPGLIVVMEWISDLKGRRLYEVRSPRPEDAAILGEPGRVREIAGPFRGGSRDAS